MGEKIVVITGASSGIGAALAEQLAARGDGVALLARREPELNAVAVRCGVKALAIVADVTVRADVTRAAAAAIARFGRIDVWVNNAGRGITRRPSELGDADLDEMMSANVKSALYGMQEVLPHFKARGVGQVINVSSVLGRIPYAVHRSAYNGSKHFLNALTANFRTEVQGTHPGIQFTLVSPGLVHTEFGIHAMHGGADSRTLPEAQPVAEVAAVIVNAIDTRRADLYTRPGAQEGVVEYYRALG